MYFNEDNWNHMFDIGLSEIIVIMIVALLVIGPKKLPDVARALGKGLSEFKRALNNVKDELNVDQIRSEADNFKNSLLFGKGDDEEKKEEETKAEPDTLEEARSKDDTPPTDASSQSGENDPVK